MKGWFSHKSKILDDEHDAVDLFESYLDSNLSVEDNYNEIERIYHKDAMSKRCHNIFIGSLLFFVFLISVTYMMFTISAPVVTVISSFIAAIYMLFLGVLVLGASAKIKRYAYDGSMLYVALYQYEHSLVDYLTAEKGISRTDAFAYLKDVREHTLTKMSGHADASYKKIKANEDSE